MTATDATGKSKRARYDALGRLVQVIDDPGGANLSATYSYDANDHLSAVDQGSQHRDFIYDGLGRLRTVQNPESGTVLYTYDGMGNVLTKRDARNITTTYTYDVSDRLTGKSASDGSVNVTYGYDAMPNSLGRLTSVSSGDAVRSYTAFDSRGLVTASSQVTNGQTYTFRYEYNAAGALTSETYPSGRTMKTGYDGAGRTAWLQGSMGSTNTDYVGSPGNSNTWIHYWPQGGIYYHLRGSGVWHAASFNKQLRQTETYEAKNNDASQMLFVSCPDWGENGNFGVYSLCPTNAGTNNNGNLKTYTEMHGGPGYSQFLRFSQTFGYDGLNRLASVSDNGGYARTFGYDQYGNMSVQGFSGMGLSSLTPYSGGGSNPFDNGNHLMAGQYDLAGNQTRVGSLQIVYDGENRQKSLTDSLYSAVSLQYGYDGEDHRVVKSGPGSAKTVYVYDAFGQLAAEYSNIASAAPCRTCYLAYDQLGSVRMVMDETGTVVARHDYLPFGEEVGSGTAGRDSHFGVSDSVRQRFTGQERDSGTVPNLDYFYARYFAGEQGRFLSADPENAGADPMNPQSWNAYSYALGSPMVFTDPTGTTISGDIYSTLKDFFSEIGNVFRGSGSSGSCAPGVIACITKTELSFNEPLVLDDPRLGGHQNSTARPVQQKSPLKTGTKTCSSSSNGGAIWTGTYTFPLTGVGALMGSLAGPEGTLPGALIGSMFGVGPTASFVPSTHSVYAGLTLVGGLGISGGGGGNINVVNVPRGQNPNSIANGQSYSITYQPTPFTGATTTKSPGSGPPVVGPSFGTRIPVAVGASYNICI